MNFDNAIVTADNEDVWTKVSVVWSGSTLQILRPYDSGGTEIVATFTGIDDYAPRGIVHTFRSSTTIVNQFGDEYSEIVVVPQDRPCGKCGTRR